MQSLRLGAQTAGPIWLMGVSYESGVQLAKVEQFLFLPWSLTITKTSATLNLSVICTIPINPFSYGLF